MQSNCKHDDGFTCLRWKNPQDLPGAWFCNLNCGYYLNFDPFTFPHSIAYTVREVKKPGLKLIPSK